MKKALKITGLLTVLFLLTSSCKQTPKPQNTNGEEEVVTQRTGPLSGEEQAHYLSVGKSIAMATFKAMSSNLQESLARGGVEEAASYCNVVALKLTDSLSIDHNASIKRTSLKLRNQDNKPSEFELEVMNTYKSSLEDNLEIEAFALPLGIDSVQFIAPIYTQKFCLTCHGVKGKELSSKNYALLAKLYPDDQAFGYKEGDFRGIWSIKMKRDWSDMK